MCTEAIPHMETKLMCMASRMKGPRCFKSSERTFADATGIVLHKETEVWEKPDVALEMLR